MNTDLARRVSIVNFTGLHRNWGCQATSWGLVELLNRGLEPELLPYLKFVPMVARHEIDRRIDRESRQDIHEAIMAVCEKAPSAARSLEYLERLTVDRYGKLAGETKSSDLVILQAEGTMGGTDFVCSARLLLLPFVAKHAWKKPVMAMNQTIFSCDEAFTQVMAAAYNSFDLVAVRENISYDAALKAGIRDVIHIPDAAFLTRPQQGAADIPDGQYFAVAGTAWAGDETYNEIFRIADRLKRETGLLPMVLVSTPADMKLLEIGREHWGDAGFASIPPETHYAEVAHVLRKCRFLLSGRYHMSIMAAAAGTPIIQLPGNSYKNEGLSAMLGGLYPVRRLDEHDAISGDAAKLLGDPDNTASELRAALAPLEARLQEAGDYFAAVQKGDSPAIPDLLRTLPGQPVAAADHYASYRANTLLRARGFGYSTAPNKGLTAEQVPHRVITALSAAYRAGGEWARNSLVQLLKSYAGRIGSAPSEAREEIYRLSPDFLAVAGVPCPVNTELQLRGLDDLHQLCGMRAGGMKNRTVPGDAPARPRPRAGDLSVHIAMLREEFATRSELLFYHAALISLIRREIDTSHAFLRFRAIWTEETDFLRRELDSRWLVSACDTFADHAPNPTVRALAMAGSILVNTVKLYETENWATGRRGQDLPYRAVTLQTQLDDGLSVYQIGSGDLIRNMRNRLRAMPIPEHPISAILAELFRRLHMQDTVFHRFHDEHYNPASNWDPEL